MDTLDPLDFWKKYELISSSKSLKPVPHKAEICRYCSRPKGEVTFSQETHLLPELLGANHILIYDECDSCNGLFSDYESHLANYVRPYITLTGTKGKRKIPKFQSRSEEHDDETRTTMEHRSPNKKHLILGKDDDYRINEENKTVTIKFRKPPIVSVKMYKSFLKIGLSLLPNRFDSTNEESFKWLTNRSDDICFINVGFQSSLTKVQFKEPFAELYKAKQLSIGNEELPELTLILGFANQMYQIFLPFSKELEKIHEPQKALTINVFPLFFADKLQAGETYHINKIFMGSEAAVSEDHNITLSYKELYVNQSTKSKGEND